MIFTDSAFYFGHTVTSDNLNLPFDEGSGETVAELNVGSYSLTEFAVEVARALNAASGGNNYVTVLDRDTRKITISGDSVFDILSNSSLLVPVSIFDLLGFDAATDKTGLNSYEGENASGSEYLPQFKLQNFEDYIDNQQAAAASINESASGIVEVIKYGDIKLMSCEIKFINDYAQGKKSPFREDLNGVSNLRVFMQTIINKGNIEFIANIADRSTFTKTFLEKTSASKDGTGFKLKEQFRSGLVGYYETGLLQFRKVEDL